MNISAIILLTLSSVRRLTSPFHICYHFWGFKHRPSSDFISFKCENNDVTWVVIIRLSEQTQFATNTWDNQVLAKSAALLWTRVEWNSNVLMIDLPPSLPPWSLNSPCRNSWSVWLRWTQPVGWIVKPIWFSNKLGPAGQTFCISDEGNCWLGLELRGVKKMFCSATCFVGLSEWELKMVTTG